MDAIQFVDSRLLDKDPESTIWVFDEDGWKSWSGVRFSVPLTVATGDLMECCEKLHQIAHSFEPGPDFHIHLQARRFHSDQKKGIEVVSPGRVRFCLLWCWSNSKTYVFDGEVPSCSLSKEELPQLRNELFNSYSSMLATNDEESFLCWLRDLAHLIERAAVVGKTLDPFWRRDLSDNLRQMKLAREPELLQQVLGAIESAE